VPELSRLLSTAPLAVGDWGVLAAGVLWPVVVMEIIKGSRARLLGQVRPTRERAPVSTVNGTPRNH
jgi:hypothetical protein